MGGHKSSDNLANVILICSLYNGLMESDSKVAEEARINGHKLSKFLSPNQPCFDNWDGNWYFLDEKGNKAVTDPPKVI